MDLKICPICHRLEDRVRAHVFLCMLAYYVEWHMRAKLRPLLFEDEQKAEAENLRSSIVAPAQRSSSAKKKDCRKHNEEGLPVQSFQTLLAEMSTLAKNQVCMGKDSSTAFSVLTQPTELQRKVFELLSRSP